MVYSDEGFCGHDPFWDNDRTWYTFYPHFTSCFESTVLTYIPTVLLWCLAPLNCCSIPDDVPKKKSLPWTLLNICRILCCIVIFALYLMSAIVDAMKGPTQVPLAGIVADSLNAFSAIWVITLHRRDKIIGNTTNGLVFSYWFLMSVLYLPVYYRFQVHAFVSDAPFSPNMEQRFLVISVVYPLMVMSFIMSCFSDSTPQIKVGNPSPILSAPPLSSLVFEWITPIIAKGYKRYIQTTDLFDPIPQLRSETNYKAWLKIWDEELKKADYDPIKGKYNEKREPSLTRSLIKAFWPSVLFAASITVCRSFVRSSPALVLNLVTNYISDSTEPLWRGLLYALLIFVANTISSLCFRHADYTLGVMGVKIKAIIIAAIYRKALRMSAKAQGDYTVGEMVNMVSVDADKVYKLCAGIGSIISSPVTILITIVLLWQYLGPSCLAGIAVILVMMPISGFLAQKNRNLQNQQMKFKDQRLKAMNEIFNSIKILKLFAWEPPFTERVRSTRDKEVRMLQIYAYLNAAIGFFWTCTPFLVALCSFMTFVLVSKANVLDPTVAFVSLTLFNQMRFSMVVIPDFISNLVQTSVSFKRINKFLLCSEMSADTIGDKPKDGDAITISNANLVWPGADQPVLKKLNMSVEKGKLVAVVGSVGSGKSSLLSAILGDLNIESGSIDVDGSIAYVPQQAWIQNATIRNNIIFTSNYDARKYQKILDASCLRTDLEILAGGDKTEIGEKGINLSGGQKQRVSIARAVYQDRDLYLFDDPLSAVDAHVGASIFNNLIGPKGMLKKTTRVLVTNNLSVLPDVDYIIVLKDGAIIEAGEYETLMDSKGVLSELLNEYMQRAEHEEVSADEIIAQPMDLEPGDLRRRRFSTMTASIASSLTDIHMSSVADFKLIEKETVEEGSIKGQIYVNYMKHISAWLIAAVLICFMMFRAMDLTNGMWLSAWSMDPLLPDGTADVRQRNIRLGVYAAIGFIQSVFNFFGVALLTKATITASSNLHNLMLTSVMRAPLSFFDVTPMGRLLNRFGKDLDQLDIQLPFITNFTLEMFFQIVGMIILISINLPVFVAVAIPVLGAFVALRQIFVKTLRQVKRMESVSRSPVNNHISETINGLSSIRCFGVQDIFCRRSDEKVDESQNCTFHVTVCNYWMSMRLEFLGNILILVMLLLIVTNRGLIDPGTAGLLISYSLSAIVAFNFLVYFSTEVEATIIAAERLDEYTNVPPEAAWKTDNPPPIEWPDKGHVIFDKYSTRYREGLDLILREVSLDVPSVYKVGVVGRTGAGKSSLILSLFRIIEAVEGKIEIDGKNIAEIGLHDLRSKLTIIPQESVLFNGSLRMNVDPNGEYSDSDIWTALERAHLKSAFANGNGLDSEITEGGQNLSAGQRQLVCLARAILRKTKILVLDEATAAVDLETDALIQETIRKVFADSTIITIAHRINTIMDSDIVVVMGAGRILELGPPKTLLENEQSEFYSLAKEAGLV